MGTCVVLIALAWNVVRLWSTTAAVLMSVVAACLPPVAAVVANHGALRRLDEQRQRFPRLPQDHPENDG